MHNQGTKDCKSIDHGLQPKAFRLFRGHDTFAGVVRQIQTGATDRKVSWQQAGHDLPAVAAVNFKIGIGGQHHGSWQNLTHAHEAGIGHAHGHIGVFVHELKNRLPFVAQTIRHTQTSIAQQPSQPGGLRSRQQEKSFDDHRFASEPRQGQIGDHSHGPMVMLLVWIEQGDERAAVNNDALRHNNERE